MSLGGINITIHALQSYPSGNCFCLFMIFVWPFVWIYSSHAFIWCPTDRSKTDMIVAVDISCYSSQKFEKLRFITLNFFFLHLTFISILTPRLRQNFGNFHCKSFWTLFTWSNQFYVKFRYCSSTNTNYDFVWCKLPKTNQI